jgi:hypothetical protein
MLARFGQEAVPETVVPKISPDTLAEMAGTTRSRASFFMNRFRKLGFIHYNGRLQVHRALLNIVLHDWPPQSESYSPWETLGMPKKPKRPQTHEEHEVQTLVDRIEKKASALPKRNLRVLKWLGTVPAVGVCTFCNREFTAPMTAMKTVADAQENLRRQFTEHTCKHEPTTTSAPDTKS